MDAIVSGSPWFIPGAFLFGVALTRFNAPPTNRSGTTFFLFWLGVVFYYALLIAIWFLVTILLRGGGLGLLGIQSAFDNPSGVAEFAAFVPIISAFVIVIASQFEQVRNWDAAARAFCISLASIPKEAEQLAIELNWGAEFHPVNNRLKALVSQEIETNIGKSAVNFENDGTPASQFTRAVSLYWLFCHPHHSGSPLPFPANTHGRATYAKVMRQCHEEFEQAVARYHALMEFGLAYFTSAKPTREMEQSLRKEIHDFSYIICRLIARFVLLQGLTAAQRRRLLWHMGFNARNPLPAFGRNQWAAAFGVILVFLVLLTIIWPSRAPGDTDQKVIRAILFAVQLGIAVLGGTSVAQRFIRKDDGSELRFPPIAELAAAGLIVVGFSLVLQIGWPLVPSLVMTGALGWEQSLASFQQRWPPLLLLPFGCTISVGLLCSYLGRLSLHWPVLAALGALINGLVLAAIGLAASYMLDPVFLASVTNGSPEFARYLTMLATGLIGAVVGAVVLAIFQRNMNAGRNVAEHLQAQPPTAALQPDQRTPVEAAGGEVHDLGRSRALRELGGYSRDHVSEIEGRYLCIRPMFSNPNVLNAYITVIRWDAARDCLVFEEKNRHDVKHTQKGLVYIPDGKPFINLVTIDNGAVRVVVVTRPEEKDIARGLILTLSNPAGVSFTPASAPVVLSKLDGEMPALGYIHPGHPEYEKYEMLVRSVTPQFALFARMSALPFPNVPAKQDATEASDGTIGVAVTSATAESPHRIN